MWGSDADGPHVPRGCCARSGKVAAAMPCDIDQHIGIERGDRYTRRRVHRPRRQDDCVMPGGNANRSRAERGERDRKMRSDASVANASSDRGVGAVRRAASATTRGSLARGASRPPRRHGRGQRRRAQRSRSVPRFRAPRRGRIVPPQPRCGAARRIPSAPRDGIEPQPSKPSRRRALRARLVRRVLQRQRESSSGADARCVSSERATPSSIAPRSGRWRHAIQRERERDPKASRRRRGRARRSSTRSTAARGGALPRRRRASGRAMATISSARVLPGA